MSNQRSVIVVTGAAGALGSALVRHLVAREKTVVALDRPAHFARLSELEPGSQRVIPLAIESSGDAQSWSRALGELARLDAEPAGAVLIAGGWAGGSRFFEGDALGVWQRMLDSNLESARGALQALLPGMVAARRGSIVLIGSRAAARPWESAGAAAYAASKAALLALAQTVAAEVLNDGVRINTVLPSTIDTPANRRSMPNVDPARWVSPESLCEVIAFLLSDAARDISGAALPVYGNVGV